MVFSRKTNCNRVVLPREGVLFPNIDDFSETVIKIPGSKTVRNEAEIVCIPNCWGT